MKTHLYIHYFYEKQMGSVIPSQMKIIKQICSKVFWASCNLLIFELKE